MRPFAGLVAIASIGAAFVACSPEEAKDEVTNHIVCDQVCDWAVDCGRFNGTFEACDDACEDKADANEQYERDVEQCAACIDHDDLTCDQNADICDADCAVASPPPAAS